MILITGEKGFIGSYLLKYLKEKGFDVIGTSVDITKIREMERVFKGKEFVIHTAVKKNDDILDEDFYNVNILGTENVVKFCLKNKSKLIHFSTNAEGTRYSLSKKISQKIVEKERELNAIILILCSITAEKTRFFLRTTLSRYPLRYLAKDIETILRKHKFNGVEVVDYEKSSYIHKHEV